MIRKYIIVADDSIKGFDEEIAKLEREWGAEEIEPSADCVSRDDLNNAISELTYWHYEDGRLVVGGDGRNNTVYKIDDVTRLVHVLPPVTPERPKGKWIIDKGVVAVLFCSECGAGTMFKSPCCPYCGAEMSGGGENEISD